MLKEVAHFLSHAPATLRLKAQHPQEDLYDLLMARSDEAGFAHHRSALAEGLRGRVLEVGCGTGLMFSHYPADVVVDAIETDDAFLAKARVRAGQSTASINLHTGRVESLPFEDSAFDAVVISLVLCSVQDVPTALSEVRRVLRPGGEVRLIEHVRSDDPVSGFFMDLLNPVWLHLNGQGCHMNRRTEAVLRENGFELRDVSAFQIFADGLPAFPMRRFTAVPVG